MHPQHKVLEIEDEESLKKENITIDISTKEFEESILKLNNLKNLIENEMKEIDKRYEKVDKEASKSFELKIEKLIQDEEDLKEKLKTEVTKIKEKLENYLSQIYNLSNDCDKIIKGLKSFQKEEKNMIKTLSYVSAINKTQKNINSFFQQPMVNLNLFYNEEKMVIEYSEYSFNGVKKQKEIQSKILNESGKKEEFIHKLQEWIGFKNLELIYRASRDGSESFAFHNKCDNQGPTICLCQNEKGNIFGGYSSVSWTSPKKALYKESKDCFLFSLSNVQGRDPIKYPIKNRLKAVYHNANYGPTFGSGFDLKIYSNFLNNRESYANIDNSYEDINGDGNSIFSGDINTSYFKLNELEVFKLSNN